MWSRKQSVCSAVSGASKGDEQEGASTGGLQLYPFAIALRVRVLQIVCGIGGLVVGAVGWLEERQKPALGLGVPAGAVTVLAAGNTAGILYITSNSAQPHSATSVYYSRGFGGWVSARSRATRHWGAPWRALGPSPCAAVPLTILWTATIAAHIAMLAFCTRSMLNLGCSSNTCMGVAAAQLSVSVTTLAAILFMLQLDLRFDAALSPPRRSDAHMCTAVSMVLSFSSLGLISLYGYYKLNNPLNAYAGAVFIAIMRLFANNLALLKVPLTSVAINSGNSGEGPEGSPLSKEKEPQPPPEPPT